MVEFGCTMIAHLSEINDSSLSIVGVLSYLMRKALCLVLDGRAIIVIYHEFCIFLLCTFCTMSILMDIYVLETFANTHLHTLNTYVKTARLYVFMHLEDFIAYVTVYRYTLMYVS